MIASVATSIDFAHIDDNVEKVKVEALLQTTLPSDYLETMDLAQAMHAHHEAFLGKFQATFGVDWGTRCFTCVTDMLKSDPTQRPSPRALLNRLI